MASIVNQEIEQCESTNLLVKELAEQGYPHGSWISAKRQTGGKGRRGNSWVSDQGNLYLSVLLVATSTKFLTWIPLTCAVALVDALESLGISADLRIKWPNDIWIDQRKVCGILCESVSKKGKTAVVAGIGLNVEQAPRVDRPTVSLSEACSGLPSLSSIRQRVLEKTLEWFGKLESEGPASVKERYFARALFKKGDEISWQDSGSKKVGTVLDLGELGELIVKAEQSEKKLYAEDISLVRKAD